MGISGLLPMLKDIQRRVHVKEYAGKRLAVDAYVWLHRGTYAYAEDLAQGKATTKYINYALQRVRMLRHFGVVPVLVFDGGPLPSKAGTELERERKRAEAKAKGLASLAEGKRALARDHFVKAIDVTPEMAFQLIKALRTENVEYVVAPYEADPQIAYLEKEHHVDGVLTEDSDLLVFGCQTVLFKLDQDGWCMEVARSRLGACKEFNFAGWTDKEFRQMAILSGCDYLDNIQGLGLKTAYSLMRRHKNAKKVVQVVRFQGQLRVPQTYLDDFARAELTFLHQRVFDPALNALTLFSPLPEALTESDLPFIGAPIDDETARLIACGDYCPVSKKPIVDIHPEPAAGVPQAGDVARNNLLATSKKGGPSRAAAQPPPAAPRTSILNYFSAPSSSSAARSTSDSKARPKPTIRPQPKPAAAAAVAAATTSAASVPTFSSRFFGGQVNTTTTDAHASTSMPGVSSGNTPPSSSKLEALPPPGTPPRSAKSAASSAALISSPVNSTSSPAALPRSPARRRPHHNHKSKCAGPASSSPPSLSSSIDSDAPSPSKRRRLLAMANSASPIDEEMGSVSSLVAAPGSPPQQQPQQREMSSARGPPDEAQVLIPSSSPPAHRSPSPSHTLPPSRSPRSPQVQAQRSNSPPLDTPRAATTAPVASRRVAGGSSALARRTVSVRADEDRDSRASEQQQGQEEDDAAESRSTQAVVATWRSRFMASNTVQTPTLAASSVARDGGSPFAAAHLTPQIGKAPSAAAVQARGRSSLTAITKRRVSSAGGGRSTSLGGGGRGVGASGSGAKATPQRVPMSSKSANTSSSSKARAEDTPQGFPAGGGDSTPRLTTNARLLAFRFKP